MAVCEVCGNDYDKAFEVIAAGRRHVFDSFECAAHALAPACDRCGCKVLGHGVETELRFYCGEHCVRADRAAFAAGHSTSGLRVFPDMSDRPLRPIGLGFGGLANR